MPKQLLYLRESTLMKRRGHGQLCGGTLSESSVTSYKVRLSPLLFSLWNYLYIQQYFLNNLHKLEMLKY